MKKCKGISPAQLKHGEGLAIVSSIADVDIPANFPKVHTKIKRYARTTPEPDL